MPKFKSVSSGRQHGHPTSVSNGKPRLMTPILRHRTRGRLGLPGAWEVLAEPSAESSREQGTPGFPSCSTTRANQTKARSDWGSLQYPYLDPKFEGENTNQSTTVRGICAVSCPPKGHVRPRLDHRNPRWILGTVTPTTLFVTPVWSQFQ